MAPRDSYYPVVLTFLVLDAIAVAVRFWARHSKNAIGWDDLVMAISFLGFVVLGALALAAIDYGIGATTVEPGFDPIKAAMYFTIAQVVYILATCISKIGVGLVLLRLADGSDNMRTLRVVLIVSMTIVGLWSLSAALVFGLQCRPVSVAWGVGRGTCLSTAVLGNTGIALSAMDVAVSWLYALLPVWMLHKAQLPIKLKLFILILLGMGAVSSIATIIRLKFVVDVRNMSVSDGLASSKVIQTTLQATVYSIIENGVSIFAAALSASRPLLKRLPCFKDIGSGANSHKLRLHSIRTIGQRSTRDRRGAYQLDDLGDTKTNSQEKFVPN